MAKNHAIGQTRFSGTVSDYKKQLKSNWVSTKIANGADPENMLYQDILYYPENYTDFVFARGVTYQLEFDVVPNFNYDMNFSIKMVQAGQSSDIESPVDFQNRHNFQLIRNIHVPKSTLADNSGASTVCLFERPLTKDEEAQHIEPEILVQIPTKIDQEGGMTAEIAPSKMPKDNILYYCPQNKTYWYNQARVYNKNDAILIHTWKSRDDGEAYLVHFSLIFTPRVVELGFNAILIEMQRISEDADIQGEAGKFGRVADIRNFALYSLANLITPGIPRYSHISIWGNSELQFSINGEDLKIGPSGFYELKDFNITSLGVTPRSERDTFVIDYQYPAAETII